MASKLKRKVADIRARTGLSHCGALALFRLGGQRVVALLDDGKSVAEIYMTLRAESVEVVVTNDPAPPKRVVVLDVQGEVEAKRVLEGAEILVQAWESFLEEDSWMDAPMTEEEGVPW